MAVSAHWRAICTYLRLALVYEELDNTEADGDEPYAGYDLAKLARGSLGLVAERIGDTLVAIDGEECQSNDAAIDGEQLHKVGDGTHEGREDPLLEQGVDEGEWHTEEGHEQVEDPQVDEEYADVKK